MEKIIHIIFLLVLLYWKPINSALQGKTSANNNRGWALSDGGSSRLKNKNSEYEDWSSRSEDVHAKDLQLFEDKVLPVVKCPEPETLGPCICDPAFNRDKEDRKWAQPLEIQCFNVTDDDEFEDVFETFFPIPLFYSLYVHWDANITILRSDVLKDVSFESIMIKTDTFIEIEDGALDSSMNTLGRLILQTNINSFPFHTLDKFTSLTHFDIGSNNITSFPMITSNTITYLDLSGNSLRELPKGAFDNLPALQDLGLSYIELEILQPGVFNGLDHVEEIDLGGLFRLLPDARFIPRGCFSGLPSLKYLDLSEGYIERVEEGAFEAIPEVHIDLSVQCIMFIEEEVWKPLFEVDITLDLSDQLNDNLQCGCDVAWLIREPMYLHQITNSTTCSDGRLLHDLRPEDIMDCP